MKKRVLLSGVACAASLVGQHHFSWQDACFNNPGAVFCPGHEYAVKKTAPKKGGSSGNGAAAGPFTPRPEDVTPDVIVVGAMNWRFADPQADAIAGFRPTKLSAFSLSRGLIAQLGAVPDQTDLRKIFEGLPGVEQVAVSVRGDQEVIMVTGGARALTAPTLGAGWKAARVTGNAMVIGPAAAVDQAVQRIDTEAPLSDMARAAGQRQRDDFSVIGSTTLAGPQAASAGVKLFSLTASIDDPLATELACQLNRAPDANAHPAWLSDLGSPMVEGSVAHVRMATDANAAQQWFGQIAATSAGRRLGAVIAAVRYLPLTEASAAQQKKPVIYGLDDSAK